MLADTEAKHSERQGLVNLIIGIVERSRIVIDATVVARIQQLNHADRGCR